ncbi:hypothetical protein DIPPA_29328 [Diplonema papillatum]|nr:hypothetical protein DIPPA_29328 [Diplonema papillatum]
MLDDREEQALKLATQRSKDIPVSDTITSLGTLDTETAKALKTGVDNAREQARTKQSHHQPIRPTGNRYAPYRGASAQQHGKGTTKPAAGTSHK